MENQGRELFRRVEENSEELKEKRYLILYVGLDEEERDFTGFEFIEGTLSEARQKVYDYCIALIDMDVDLNESTIVPTDKPVDEAITLYEFLKHMIESDLVRNTEDLNMEDYAPESIDEFDEDSRGDDI